MQFDASGYPVDENAGTATLIVDRTSGFTGAVSVGYQTDDSTTSGTDYTSASSTLTWADGDTMPKTLTVLITDQGLYDETFRQLYVALTAPTGGASLGANVAVTVTVTENDPAPAALPVITSPLMVSGMVGQLFYYLIEATNSPTDFTAPACRRARAWTGPARSSVIPPRLAFTPSPSTRPRPMVRLPLPLTITIAGTGGSTGNTDPTLSVVDSPDPVVVGGSLTYTFTFGNKGPGKASGVVLQVIKDSKMTFVPVSSGNNLTVNGNALTFPLPDLASGDSNTVVFKFTADIVGTLTVGATVSGVQNDPVASNSGLIETTLVVARGTALSPQITSPASANAQVGVPFTYQITAANNPTSFYATNLPAGLPSRTARRSRASRWARSRWCERVTRAPR